MEQEKHIEHSDLTDIREFIELSKKAMARIEYFSHWIVDISDRAQRGNMIEAIKDMVEEIGYQAWLEETSNDPNQAIRKMGNVEELVAWIGRMVKQDNKQENIGDIAAKLTLMDILARQEDENQDDAVNLMTLHAAKGLEFPHVFIIGMEEEVLPHRTSIEEDNVEEERRLAYVGITRAQRSLVFTMAKTRKRYGEKTECEASRFLTELPEDDLVWLNEKTQVDPEERKQRGKAHLSNIRGLLE